MWLKWWLGSRVKHASEERLEIAGESCVRWEIGCGGLVVLGLLCELAIAWVHPAHDSFWDRWGGVCCDAAVALGGAGEIFFSSRSHKHSSELTRRSNQRLADLKEATRWRILTNAERIAVTEALKSSGPAASVRFSVLAPPGGRWRTAFPANRVRIRRPEANAGFDVMPRPTLLLSLAHVTLAPSARARSRTR